MAGAWASTLADLANFWDYTPKTDPVHLSKDNDK